MVTFCKADLESEDYDPLSLHIFYKNQEVSEHNSKALNVLRERGYEIVTIIAKDSLVDSSFANEKSKRSILQSLKTKKATGLASILCFLQ